MKITKFEHACFTVEQDGDVLVVDPGGFTTDFIVPDHVVAVVITHEHADHLAKEHLQAIIAKNPDAVIIAHGDVTAQLSEFQTKSVVPNEGIKVGAFELEFFGGEHAFIMKEWPIIANLGVMINDRLYYPGDSFTVPERLVEVLALPVAAPWLKISESLDFLEAVKPKFVFPTHDAVLSDAGKGLPDRIVPQIAQKVGAEYQRLHEPIDI
jgi:L-ascorbate metabolism protein UlaG (beta-lactamase superfamily)